MTGADAGAQRRWRQDLRQPPQCRSTRSTAARRHPSWATTTAWTPTTAGCVAVFPVLTGGQQRIMAAVMRFRPGTSRLDVRVPRDDASDLGDDPGGRPGRDHACGARARGRGRQPGARLPEPRPAADRRRQARRRGLLVARRQAAGLPERARRRPIPFYQIYVLDFATGETKRISPGMGKTTCAFFRPGTDQILFASTHHDPKSKQYQDDELAFRASGKERRYAWDYDPEMEIYAFAEKTGALTRLTNATRLRRRGRLLARRPVDRRSRRCATPTTARCRPEEQKQLATDPSYFGEIYIMKADGSGQTPPHQHAGLRRRPLLHDGRPAHRLAALRRARAHRRRLDDEARRHRRAGRSRTSGR